MRYSISITGIAASALLTVGGAPARANVVTDWNALAMGCITRTAATTALDLTLVQVAVHDAVQAIEKRYEPYLAMPPATGDESKAAAAAAAAYRVLSDNRICPPPAPPAADTVQANLDTAFAPYQAGGDPGLEVGYAAADAMLAQYRAAGTQTWMGRVAIGEWRPTPPGNAPMAFPWLATTTTFTMSRPSQFRPGPPPPMTSERYRIEYDEVKEKGSAASHPAALQCPAPRETDMARFWSGNFGVQWNQVLRDIAINRQLGIGDTARLLALASLAAADAGIAVWDSKLHYNFWRPMTAIHEGDADPNRRTAGDTSWVPFIHSIGGQNPPYPDYVSGANGLTGAYVGTLQLFIRSDHVPFAVHKATPPAVAICTNPRTFRRLSEAAEEVVDARIYLGIHFRSADAEARRLGERVALWTFMTQLRPAPHHD